MSTTSAMAHGVAVAAAHARLKVEQVSYAYSATDRSAPKFTLGPVSFEANQRELVAILGPNASGKSTLLKLLAGLLKPLSGRIEVDGEDVSAMDLRTRAQRIALVAQESELLFPLRVWEYVLQGRYPYGRRLRFESAEDCLMAGNALAQVGADSLRDRWMDQLSGGEKQRVILSRAMAQQPSLLAAGRADAAFGYRRQSGTAAAAAETRGREPLHGDRGDARTESGGGVFGPDRAAAQGQVFADRVAGGSVRAAGARGSV